MVRYVTWIHATIVRALKTFAETAIGIIGADQVQLISEVAWHDVVSISATAAVVSVLISVRGLPEVPGAAPLDRNRPR